MSRSTKKGPYVADSLMKKVEAMNEAGKKSVVKTWSLSLIHILMSSSLLPLPTSLVSRLLLTV